MRTTLFSMAVLLAAACDTRAVPRDGGALADDAGVDAGADVADASPNDAGPNDAGSNDAGSNDAGPSWPSHPLPPLPLRTQGRWILDATAERFKMAGVNWYGADQDDFVVGGLDRRRLEQVAEDVHALGFNTVRIPWSNELVERNPVVDEARLAANPDLHGLRALDVLDRVIEALAHAGLVVVLDNHTSAAGWCCDEGAGGLWYTDDYPEATWISHWRTMTSRYLGQPAVAAVDLRNELRGGATWGGDPATDWHAAATRGGNAVLEVNPNLLVIVEGLDYASDLGGPYTTPVVFDVPNRLVYSAHDYAFFHTDLASYDALATTLGANWGYLIAQGQPYTAPVLVGEFGTCNTSTECVREDGNDEGRWFAWFMRYLAQGDFDWIYWPLNGTQSRAAGRTLDAVDWYGVVNEAWDAPALPEAIEALQAAQPITQRPE